MEDGINSEASVGPERVDLDLSSTAALQPLEEIPYVSLPLLAPNQEDTPYKELDMHALHSMAKDEVGIWGRWADS